MKLLPTFALCLLPFAFSANAAPTFSHDIAPLVYNNCAACHHAGEVAPFPLTSYRDVAKRADQIAEITTSRTMPPWHAEPGYGDFQNVRRLTDDQIKLISDWVAAGAPEGNPAETPALPKSPEGWSLGQPDLVLKMPEPFTPRRAPRRLPLLRHSPRHPRRQVRPRRRVPPRQPQGHPPRAALPRHHRRRPPP